MKAPALLLALAACATAPAARGIAGDLNDRLENMKTWPLSPRCQAIDDACDRCRRAGLEPKCWADGWNDADHDAWIVAVCLPRASRCSAGAHNPGSPGSTPGPATTRAQEGERP